MTRKTDIIGLQYESFEKEREKQEASKRSFGTLLADECLDLLRKLLDEKNTDARWSPRPAGRPASREASA